MNENQRMIILKRLTEINLEIDKSGAGNDE
jgi:hypothetical protein